MIKKIKEIEALINAIDQSELGIFERGLLSGFKLRIRIYHDNLERESKVIDKIESMLIDDKKELFIELKSSMNNDLFEKMRYPSERTKEVMAKFTGKDKENYKEWSVYDSQLNGLYRE